MENDVYELLRASGITYEKIAEIFEEKLSKLAPKKLRPNYKDKCKIRWLDIPNKVMQGRIRRFC